ncbi:hypothetical protein [Pararhodobacter zhoushanensis]|uniref:Uncharacterized protein n=1 Tax=Pararhodobacter zhoushanensis TaxID=2479545 RepID=A0ABT3H3Q0_9RHOB|nr:hypothetical protein [Pararhodobacter zhoushanensis]MCW1934454.1 hypothetical protein [Pararhodobacter zhoushanensis]
MPSIDFRTRLDHVLASRVEARKEQQHRPAQRLVRGLSVIAGTLVCFFVLKAAALAHDGQAFAAPAPAEPGISAQIYHWFAGADPISSTLAYALRAPEPAPVTL